MLTIHKNTTRKCFFDGLQCQVYETARNLKGNRITLSSNYHNNCFMIRKSFFMFINFNAFVNSIIKKRIKK